MYEPDNDVDIIEIDPDTTDELNDYINEHLLVHFKELLSNGLEIRENLTVLIYLHGFIGDAPARSKCCNSIQFNGENGCLHCLNPGLLYGRKRVYKGNSF